MLFNLHSTKKVERDMLIETGEYQDIVISPADFHSKKPHRPMVWEEDTGKYYEHDTKAFFDTLYLIENHKPWNIEDTPYFKLWAYKGQEVMTRLGNLPELYWDIYHNGIKEPVQCEATGERLNGSFRTKIAMYQGIESVKARMYSFKWDQIDLSFIKRKLDIHWLSTGKDYYEFDYGFEGLKNIYDGGPVYRENAVDRWEFLKQYLKGKSVLDLGCNEGYMSIQCALTGRTVIGFDHDMIHNANLNKLIFEFREKRELPIHFEWRDISTGELPLCDTTLLLNVIYHIPRNKQLGLLRQLRGSRVVAQCNLRKEHEKDVYFGSHPDDMIKLFKDAGFKSTTKINWRDKPIIIAC